MIDGKRVGYGTSGISSGSGTPRCLPDRWQSPASCLIRGCWQLSHGHGSEWSREQAFAALDAAARSAFGTEPHHGLDADTAIHAHSCRRLFLDCADIYTGVESLIGEWLTSRNHGNQVAVHTKFVPDLDMLARIDRAHVRDIVHRSRDRLQRDTLDMVQLHWWDFAVRKWVQTAEWLAELQQDGVIRHIGVTNFDVSALRVLLDAGVPIASNQVQLSLLDRRPLSRLARFCDKHGVALLCYGTLAGGLLAGPIDTATRPNRGLAHPETTPSRSITKYSLIAKEVGGKPTLTRARQVLAEIATSHGATLADVAIAYALAQPAVAAAIVGLSRRGLVPRPDRVPLTSPDISRLEAAVPDTVQGGVYQVERDRAGPHGRIMHYNLNRVVASRTTTNCDAANRDPADRDPTNRDPANRDPTDRA